jgi:hypothetical protein
MFSYDKPVNTLRGETQLLGKEDSEPHRIQIGAGSNNTVLGESAQLPADVSEDVHCGEGIFILLVSRKRCLAEGL